MYPSVYFFQFKQVLEQDQLNHFLTSFRKKRALSENDSIDLIELQQYLDNPEIKKSINLRFGKNEGELSQFFNLKINDVDMVAEYLPQLISALSRDAKPQLRINVKLSFESCIVLNQFSDGSFLATHHELESSVLEGKEIETFVIPKVEGFSVVKCRLIRKI